VDGLTTYKLKALWNAQTKTFKRRLWAYQQERGFPASHWAKLLSKLAMIIDTTTTRTLPSQKTPFKIWSGQKPRWTRPNYLTTEPLGVNDDLLHVNNKEFGDNPVLTEVERRVAKHNRRPQSSNGQAKPGLWSYYKV
jgi:hypothetical protein